MRRREWLLPATVAAVIGASAPGRADEPTATSAVSETEPRDSFVADDGARRSFLAEYRAGDRPGRRDPHYFRAALEMGALVGMGYALYKLHTADHSHADYPDPRDRFANLHAAFDTNEFNINALGHPGAGAMYHLFSRTNGLSIPAAFVYSAASSAVWELGGEIHEKASLNDFVITPFAGLPIGETLVHLGDYFNSAPRPRWYHEVLGVIFGTTHKLHRALDDYERGPARLPADRLGYSSYYAHRFGLLVGPTGIANDAGDRTTTYQVRLNAEIVGIPGFLRPGRFGVTFSDGNFVEMLVQTNLGDTSHAWDFLFDANLFGRYAQDISARTRSGHASMFAFSTSARYANRFLLGRRDNYFVAHAGGPSFKLWAVNGDFVARLDGAAHFDFAAIRSLAYPGYVDRYGEEGAASSLKAHSYYYGIGWSGVLRGTLAYKAFELGGRAFFGRYESIDRFDRFHDSERIHTTDRLAEIEGWVSLVPRSFPVQVRGFVEQIPRSSTMGSMVTTKRWDRRYGITIGFHL